jgi:hypothetical protein
MSQVLIIDNGGNPATTVGTPAVCVAAIDAAFVAGTPIRITYSN